jgi:hypothetical protein
MKLFTKQLKIILNEERAMSYVRTKTGELKKHNFEIIEGEKTNRNRRLSADIRTLAKGVQVGFWGEGNPLVLLSRTSDKYGDFIGIKETTDETEQMAQRVLLYRLGIRELSNVRLHRTNNLQALIDFEVEAAQGEGK